jgi:hypothetical protein
MPTKNLVRLVTLRLHAVPNRFGSSCPSSFRCSTRSGS